MLLVFLPIYIWADEGMWLPCCLSKQTQQVMKDMGLNLTPRQLYNPGGAALSNAVVSFGGFCSGGCLSGWFGVHQPSLWFRCYPAA